jgi:hypothetical protein
MGDIVDRLKKRKEFFTNDFAHWLMSPKADADCQEAAAEILSLRAQLEQAVREEREACAVIADEHECMAACLDYKCDKQIAIAIRARRKIS